MSSKEIMLKRIISILLVAAIAFSVSACGNSKPETLTQETYENGKQALEVMDKYLAGKMDAETAERKLAEIYDQLEAEGDALHEKADGGDIDALSYAFFNGHVCFNVSSFVLGMFELENTYGNTYDCQAVQDCLADALEVN